jgi:hypothetical protein
VTAAFLEFGVTVTEIFPIICSVPAVSPRAVRPLDEARLPNFIDQAQVPVVLLT